MITSDEYRKALRIVKEYYSQEAEFKQVKLLGIHDNHHDYFDLEIGKLYDVYKFIPARSTRHSDSFVLMINKKRHIYKTFSNMMTWEYIK